MTCIIKNVCVRTLLRNSHQVTNLLMLGRGICPIFSSPPAFDSFTAPAPGDLPSIRQKKSQIPGGYRGEGGGVFAIEVLIISRLYCPRF